MKYTHFGARRFSATTTQYVGIAGMCYSMAKHVDFVVQSITISCFRTFLTFDFLSSLHLFFSFAKMIFCYFYDLLFGWNHMCQPYIESKIGH